MRAFLSRFLPELTPVSKRERLRSAAGALVGILTTGFVCRVSVPAEALPVWLRPWTVINPIYHFGVISRGSLIRGSGIEDVWVNVLALVVFTLVLMSLSVWRFRQQLS